MKKMFMAVLVLLAVIMMVAVRAQAGNVKVSKSPDGKNSVSIGLHDISHYPDLVKLIVSTSQGVDIFNASTDKNITELPSKVVWSKKSDFALIYYHPSFPKGKLILYDFKTKDKDKRMIDLIGLYSKNLSPKSNYYHIIDWAKIDHKRGECMGRIHPPRATDIPSIMIMPNGDIRYFVNYRKNGIYAMTEETAKEFPVACREAGNFPLNGIIVVAEVVQKRNGKVVSSKIYYSDDSYPIPEDF